jgi:hypothetical protein
LDEATLIGGLLSFVPVLNIFTFGLLYRYARQVMKTQYLRIPAFKGWIKLFKEGLMFLAILLLFSGIPVLAGYVVSFILRVLSFGLLGTVAYFPVTLALALSPILSLSALFSFIEEERWTALLQWQKILNRIAITWRALVIPLLAVFGMLLIGLPLYGIAVFTGFLVMIGYTFLCFSQIEADRIE